MVYMLLITVAAGLVGGRILGVARVYEPYYYRDPPTARGTITRGEWAKGAARSFGHAWRQTTVRAGTPSVRWWKMAPTPSAKREITGPDPETRF